MPSASHCSLGNGQINAKVQKEYTFNKIPKSSFILGNSGNKISESSHGASLGYARNNKNHVDSCERLFSLEDGGRHEMFGDKEFMVFIYDSGILVQSFDERYDPSYVDWPPEDDWQPRERARSVEVEMDLSDQGQPEDDGDDYGDDDNGE
ncbi:unnamed protein product [Penicillium pancosmium]